MLPRGIIVKLVQFNFRFQSDPAVDGGRPEKGVVVKARGARLVNGAAKIFAWSFGLLTLVLFAGCAQNYGQIHWVAAVTDAFKSARVDPNYRYYYYGVGMQTYAIVGLEPKWQMNSKMWRQLQPDSQEFKVTASRIWSDTFYSPYRARGGDIMDPNGEKVGIYYSSLSYPTVKFEPENQVMVILDTPFMYGPGADNGKLR